jgi:lysophospholipase L1-like esterase
VSFEFLITGHGAWWGRQAAQAEHTIKGWVQQDNPDYLLLMLGFNDLG